MKGSVILYIQQYESIKDLSLEDKGLLLDAIFHYAKTGKELDQLSPVTKIAFSFIRNAMDNDSEKYQKRCEKNQENIRKRWNELNKVDTNVYDRIPKIQANTKRTDNDYDYDIKKEIYKEKIASAKTDALTRMGNFKNSLEIYIGQYSKNTIDDFFNYWSELNKSETKMKFEMQKTWELSRRLSTWERNSYKFDKNKSINNAKDETAKLNIITAPAE